jgi:O-antigen/teichoic acid export membrane protein
VTVPDGPAGDTSSASVIGGRGLASVGIASIVAAASGYLVLVLAARYLSKPVNADFLVYWALLFGGFGVLGGVQQEATRSVGTAERLGSRLPGAARVLPWSIVIGAAAAVLALVLAPWWRPLLLGDHSGALIVAVLGLVGVAYSGHLAMVGTLSGERRWTASSALIGGEALLRVALVAAAVLIGAGLVGVEIAAAASAALWLFAVPFSATLRRAARARGDSAVREMVPRVLQAMLASAAAAALVVGFPTLLRATTSDAQWASAAPIVLAISLTRAPLLIPLNAYQAVAISYFLDPHRSRSRALIRIVLLIVAAGLVGAVLATLIGPWLMTTVFGPDYAVSGLLLGALTLASAALAVLTLTGSGILALGRHLAYAAGWFVATAVAVGILLVDLPLGQRAALALSVGPVVGIAVHLFALRGSRPGAETVTAG